MGSYHLAVNGVAERCSCYLPCDRFILIIKYQSDLDGDSVIRGRYVILQSKDCHALWVSSKVIEASLPFPETIEGGVIVRDDSGKPTGRHR